MRTKPCLTLADVKKMLAASEAEAAKNKWAVAISIVDDGGFLLGFERMDGAAIISAEVSLGKARTSAMTRRPSKFFEDRVKDRPAFITFPAGLLISGRSADHVSERMRRCDRCLRGAIARGRTDRAGGRQFARIARRSRQECSAARGSPGKLTRRALCSSGRCPTD